MSSSRRSRSQSGSSRITDHQIIQLLSKLGQLVPEIHQRRSDKRRKRLVNRKETMLLMQVSASKVLQETCNHIRNLHREVDDLSERISHLLSSIDSDSPEAAIIRSLLMQ